MPEFDVAAELARLPLGRDIRWSAPSLGADEGAFATIHVALQRLEAAGEILILEEVHAGLVGEPPGGRVTFRRIR